MTNFSTIKIHFLVRQTQEFHKTYMCVYRHTQSILLVLTKFENSLKSDVFFLKISKKL